MQSGEFLGKFLGPLLKTGLPLVKNVLKTLAKSVLIPLGLLAVASPGDAGIHKVMFNTLYWRYYDKLETNSLFVHFWRRNSSRILFVKLISYISYINFMFRKKV